MSLKRPRGDPGTLVVLEHTSKILKGNPLGDPHLRKLGVWLPPGYDDGGRSARPKRYPVLYDLVGFTGSGLAHANWKPFVDGEFRTLEGREHRGCFGKSSGGYGSIIHGMQYTKYWGAIADHRGLCRACYTVLRGSLKRAVAMSTLTIRLDPALEKQLNVVAKATKRQKSEIVRDALRRQLALTQFRALRSASLPLAEAAGYLTDEDVFRDVS